MTARPRLLAALAALMVLVASAPAHAVRPDEVLADPALEKRARDLSSGLRCLVCQNQSIDDSDAELARDLRILVRERITQGDSDSEVLRFVVSRYGEFVLLNPRLSMRTILLWGAPVALLAAGGLVLAFGVRRRKTRSAPGLSAEENARLDEILNRRD
ncbi:MAG: cytochrome c-type biogenesis protein CcmH [Notoacmeibacter sp.]|nr:cytochrome c-type biogenesis protein CcmH [Notoacmeibacter sp.]